MPQSPSKTEVRKARVSKEEQIVQRIVDLLNEKGYEYERDARPLICWKFNVNSSRDLTMEQKEEVKKALEEGTFEKWGEEYKNQVLGDQVDVVKQIEQMASMPEQAAAKETDKSTAADKKTKKPAAATRRATSAASKKEVAEKIAAKNDELLPSKSKDGKTPEKEQTLVEAANIKIEKLDKPSGDAPKINLKLPAEQEQNIPKKPSETASQNTVSTPASPTENTVVEETTPDVQPAKTPVTPSKKDHLLVKTDNEHEKFQMGYEEAQKIVKARFSPELQQEFSTSTVVIVFLTIVLFLASLTINFILLTGKELPGWLKFICNLFS